MRLGPVASKHGNLRPTLNSGSMALGSTTCRQRHGVERGGGRERGGERTRGAGETGNRHRTATGEAGESGGGKEAKEGEGKKETVGGERSDALEVLRRRKCRFYSALTISRTEGAEGWNRCSRECPRPTSTWAFPGDDCTDETRSEERLIRTNLLYG